MRFWNGTSSKSRTYCTVDAFKEIRKKGIIGKDIKDTCSANPSLVPSPLPLHLKGSNPGSATQNCTQQSG